MSDTTTPAAPTTETSAPVTDAMMDKYFSTRGGEDEDTGGSEAAAPNAPETRPEAPDRPVTEAKAPEKAAEQGGEKVPLATLLEERRQRQAVQTQMAQIQAELEALRNPKPVEQGAKIPDINEDPLGHFKAVIEQQNQKLQAFEQARTQEQQQRYAQEAHQALMTDFIAQEEAMVKTVPDYYEATKHLKDSRIAELRGLGFNDQQIGQALMQDITQLAIMARQQGKNPAQLSLEIAKQRGYQAKAPPPVVDTSVEEARIEAAQQGQALGKTIQTSGGGGRGEMTAERLASMPPAEFDKWCLQNPEKADRLMGA